MIIGSFDPHTIGDRLPAVNDHQRVTHTQPCIVVRESTFDEWLRQEADQDVVLSATDLARARTGYFYEITTD